MRGYSKTEIAVGLFAILGLLAIGYLSINLGGLVVGAPDRYAVTARFASIGDLKTGAPVRLAGVRVGKVRGIGLRNYVAEVELAVDTSLELPTDTIASIETAGLLGESYVSLSPGAAREVLRGGDRIRRTEPALNLLDLVGKYAFDSGGDDDEDRQGGGGATESPFEDPLEGP